MTESTQVTIYTDGACLGNPGVGGWGAILISGKNEKRINGNEKETTNNRMELMAAIEALNVLKKSCEVKLYTDSSYVKNGITQWLPNWKARNWKTAAKKPVKNADLWQLLDQATQRHRISWHWVKGHSGDHYNDIADELATTAAAALQEAR